MSRALARRRRNPSLPMALSRHLPARVTAKHVAIAGGVVGGVAVLYWLFAGGPPPLKGYLKQGDARWSKKLLGKSDELTIGGYGCMLTAWTMAVNALLDEDFTPDLLQATALQLSSSSFSGPNLALEAASDAVGVYAPNSDRWSTPTNSVAAHKGATVDELRAAINSTLKKRGFAMVHVDKDFSGTGDHFVLIYKAKGGKFIAADPAIGAPVELDKTTLMGKSDWGYKIYDYKIVGVAPILKAA